MTGVVKKILHRLRGFDSGGYWERRYAGGGNSGIGSYGRLAEFKAEVVNRLIREHGLKHMVDWGFGDGNQLRLFSAARYTGIDVSLTAVKRAQEEWEGDATKSFIHSSELPLRDQGDLALSFDVLYHLIEDSVFNRYMNNLLDSSSDYVLIYSSNRKAEKIEGHHVMDREFTSWMVKHARQFELVENIKNRYPYDSRDPENTSSADFWLYRRVKVQ